MEISTHVLSDLSDLEIDHGKKIASILVKNLANLFDEKKHSVILNEISKIKKCF